MNVFNFNPGSDIHVNTDDDKVTIRFNGETFAVNPTTSGISVTNDWNTRHFTLAFNENSILYHLTREDINDRRSGKHAIPPEEFVAEIYGYVRSLATPVRTEDLNLDFVGRGDVDELRTYLKDKGVLYDTPGGIRFDGEKVSELETELNESPTELAEVYQRVLTPVSIDDAMSGDTGEHIFFYPKPGMILVLFVYPDGHIGVTNVEEVLEFWEFAGGSQIMDHMVRSMKG